MGRRKQDPNPPPQLPSPDKRSKSSKNPLRRGPSSRNMQQIPSPNASTTELPLSTPREEAPVQSTIRQPSLAKTPSLEPQNERGELNGDVGHPASDAFHIPNMTNGTPVDQNASRPEVPQSRPSSAKPEEARILLDRAQNMYLLAMDRSSVIPMVSPFRHQQSTTSRERNKKQLG